MSEYRLASRNHVVSVPWFHDVHITQWDDRDTTPPKVIMDPWRESRVRTWKRRDRWGHLMPNWWPFTKLYAGPRCSVIVASPIVYELTFNGEGAMIHTPRILGLDPTGEQDSTKALQAAFDIAAMPGNGPVSALLPPGEYRVTETLEG